MDHIAGKQRADQTSQAALAAAAAAVHRHHRRHAAGRQPGDPQQRREVPAAGGREDPVVGGVGLPVPGGVMDRRTAPVPVRGQILRHPGQARRLQNSQVLRQERLRSPEVPGRQAEQVRQQRRGQRQVIRPRQIQAAQAVPDVLRRPVAAGGGNAPPLRQQRPEGGPPVRSPVARTQGALVGQLHTVPGLHQGIAGQVIVQDL